MKDQTHERAVAVVKFWLVAKGRELMAEDYVYYTPAFVKEHKLEKRFQGHSYDIWTNEEIIEVDDYKKHSKKNQKINDGIAGQFVEQYLSEWKFYRVLKEEIVDSKGYLQPTAAEYLRDNMF